MLFKANAGASVALTTTIRGIGGPGATADFTLKDSAAPVPPIGTSGGFVGSYTFQVPGQPSGTMTALTLETLAAFIGVTSADIFGDAVQSGVGLPNLKPAIGHTSDWLSLIMHQGVIQPDSIFIYFQ